MAVRLETLTLGPFEAPLNTTIVTIDGTYTASDNTTVNTKDLYVPVTDQAGHMTIDLAPVTLTVVGAYTASFQAVDQNGAPVGPSTTDSFIISAPTTMLVSIPVSATGTTS